MGDDAEDLKVHRIHARQDARTHLAVLGQRQPEVEDVDEAWGGSEEREAPASIPMDALRERVVCALKSVFDPEIPLNIYDLGLIYGIEIDDARDVEIAMTLTAPACPVAGMLVSEVARKVGEVAGVRRSHVRLVWDPPWTRDRMSEEALLELGLL